MLENFIQSFERQYPEYVQYQLDKPGSPAVFSDWPGWIPDDTRRVFNRSGVDRLYRHQADGLNCLHQGENLVISTSTASGKSLIYQAPIVTAYHHSPEATALLVFPTKALARDQFNKLMTLFGHLDGFDITRNWLYATPFDGDTSPNLRSNISESGKVIFTNPDMLHFGFLPYHHKWSRFLSNLQYIILEEVHQYNGVFGSHLSFILQRLQRLCRHYGSNPQFIGTSASIHNPAEHLSSLIQKEVASVTEDYSPKNDKLFLGVNPLVIDPELHVREHPYNPVVKLCRLLVENQVQTIIFCSSRRSVEMLYHSLLDNLQDLDLEDRVILPYRGGYTKSSRREKEDLIRSGKAIITIATNALELGIDIEGVDCVITLGFPGSIASMQQQAGRAGRKHQLAAHIFVASQSPIDQFMINNPQWITSNPERARINRDNLLIALPHIQSALHELPFDPTDEKSTIDIPNAVEIFAYLLEKQLTQELDGKHFWLAERRPHDQISIRSTTTDQIELIDTTNNQKRKIGDIDLSSAIWMTHTGAVYFHDGIQYLVEEFDAANNRAWLTENDSPHVTKADSKIDIQILDSKTILNTEKLNLFTGEIRVTTSVDSYRIVDPLTGLVLGRETLDMPSITMQTTGLWMIPQESVINQLNTPASTLGNPDYGNEWDVIRKSIRQRDDFRCVLCGRPESGQTHHVHHLTPIRNFQSVESANHESNLVTLCPTCHRTVESAVRIRSPLGGLAYALQNILPVYISTARYDVLCRAITDQKCFDLLPTVLIYDNVPGGLGMSVSLPPSIDDIFDSLYRAIIQCDCIQGCPSCIGPPGELSSGNKDNVLDVIRFLFPEH